MCVYIYIYTYIYIHIEAVYEPALLRAAGALRAVLDAHLPELMIMFSMRTFTKTSTQSLFSFKT